jgi:hypothetical protein
MSIIGSDQIWLALSKYFVVDFLVKIFNTENLGQVWARGENIWILSGGKNAYL